MPDWRMTGTYFKSCNCDPGCLRLHGGADPSQCEGILGMDVREGHLDDTPLDGIKWAVAYHWPEPLHEGTARSSRTSMRG